MNKLILTIPHSSTYFINDGTIKDTIFPQAQKDVLYCADLYTDILFDYANAYKVVCPVSRMLVDVERYIDREKEVMATFDRGLFYKVLNDGKTIYRKNINIDLLDIYTMYHNQIKKFVNLARNQDLEPFIIDCHSFNEEPFYFDLCKDKKDRDVDICFGYNDKTDLPNSIFNKIDIWAKINNYTYTFNSPYSGSMTCDNCNKSLMIELNKRIYLLDDNITPKTTINELKTQICSLLDMFIKD